MREGVAPSSGLARVFAQFRDWLLSIYQSIKGLGAEITPEIRGVFDRMLETERDDATRLALVRQELESGFATVFRQTMMVRYEQDAYGARADGQALTPDRLSEFWFARNAAYCSSLMCGSLPGTTASVAASGQTGIFSLTPPAARMPRNCRSARWFGRRSAARPM